ncbi:hypothetical protein E2562_009254 [Oryza meyeriana var. granulata]|uniref:Uncharacterized protein n=1 Tax=Oryza meyeriana var. granulata TaxID=110450 RepID=A0A6G1D1J3_9ORYZ|nr:hypothetical protein E2562_009254 [Oryza meyeriana var. granulata]
MISSRMRDRSTVAIPRVAGGGGSDEWDLKSEHRLADEERSRWERGDVGWQAWRENERVEKGGVGAVQAMAGPVQGNRDASGLTGF